MIERRWWVAPVGSLFLLAAAQAQQPREASPRIEVVLERMERSEWRALNPQTVLDSGDQIRFRFESTIAGWLYVYYSGAGGESGWLLPKEGERGHLVVAREPYQIPGAGGSYAVSGPPGFDVVYWMLSSKPVPAESLLPQSARKAPRTLIPRCPSDPGTLRACVDDRAGPAAISESDKAPLRNSSLRARELKINKESAVSTIEPADRNTGVIIYEFRLAHR